MVNRATLRVEGELQRYLSEVLDGQTRAVVAAWGTAWDRAQAELDAALLDLASTAEDRITRTMVLRSQRAQAGLASLAEALEIAAMQSGQAITADLQRVIEAAAEAEYEMLATQTGPRRGVLMADLIRADPGQVAAMVQRATETITALTLPLAAETTATIRAELLRGITVGDNPRTAARRMVRAAEDKTNFGLARAMTISRTEMLDATRTAAQHVDARNGSLVAGWTWVAALTPRTCPACLSMHGRVFPTSEPGPLGHQQCRCARVPITKSWRDLGIDLPDTPRAVPDAEAFFRGLPESQQVAILGQQRHQAWLAGDYPMERWATRRRNEGWRDSYVVSRAPKAA